MALFSAALRSLSLTPSWSRSPLVSIGSSITSSTSNSALKSLLPWISIPAIALNVPGLISDIWEGILKAVPKKKTTHSRSRSRQLAGKALKDTHSVNSCSVCGRPKKAHTLCPYCVSDIKQEWAKATKKATENAKADS